jgi:hypothetical protein
MILHISKEQTGLVIAMVQDRAEITGSLGAGADRTPPTYAAKSIIAKATTAARPLRRPTRLFPVFTMIGVALGLLDVGVPESFLAANRISFFPKSKTATTFFKNASPRKESEIPAVGTVAPMVERHTLLPYGRIRSCPL